MIFPLSARYVVAGLFASKAIADVCRTNLLVDDFAMFSDRLNSVGLKAGDDNSMIALAAEHGTLSFVPAKNSYFFESLPCIDAVEEGYGAISFRMKAPKGASFAVELQTKENCGESEYQSSWHYVEGFTGQTEIVVIPLKLFGGANARAIDGFSWGTWDFYDERGFVWTLSDVEFTCNPSD